MRRDLLRLGLEQEIDLWSEKTPAELRSELVQPVCYQSMINAETYQVEVQMLEDSSDYVHLSVSVDDRSFWRSLRPLSSSFLIFDDGRVER